MTEPDHESDEIRGVVVDFINDREILMSVGKKDGVKIGMQFAVLVPGGVPVEFIVDGETVTENAEVPKAIVKVVRLNGERLSVGRTFRVIKGRPAYEVENPYYMFRNLGLGSITGFDPAEPVKRYPAQPDRVETFGIDRNETIRRDLDMKVRKGDEVRMTTSDEFLL